MLCRMSLLGRGHAREGLLGGHAVRSGMHEAKASILVDGALVLRACVVIDLDPAAVEVLGAMVVLLLHPDLAHHGIVHLIEASTVDVQKHLRLVEARCTVPLVSAVRAVAMRTEEWLDNGSC